MKFYSSIAFVAILIAENSYAASFDCNKAESTTEKLICSDAKLSELDSQLNKKFISALSNESTKEEIVKDQINWLGKTRDKCKDTTCLELIYSERIKYIELKSTINSPGQGFILTQSNQEPEKDLAKDAEIIVVSGYEPESGDVDITVDRPGSNVILVLSAYESVYWKINATANTTIKAILVGGYKKHQVFSAYKTPYYRVDIPDAKSEDNIDFKKILIEINRLFSVRRIQFFNGSYKIPQKLIINTIDTSNTPKLSLDGPATIRPTNNFSFNLLNANNKAIEWTLAGTKNTIPQTYITQGIAVSADGKSVYKLQNNGGIEIFDSTGGKVDSAKPPAELPNFSWETDITYDSKRKFYSVISFGGEGYLYRFDPARKIWIDAKSAHNFDISSIAYDKKMDRYVGWGCFTSKGELVVFNGEGDFLFSRPIAEKLEGYGRLYDKNNSGAAPLKVVTNGNSIALIAMAEGNVTHIWNYDFISDKAILTYKSEFTPRESFDRSPTTARWK